MAIRERADIGSPWLPVTRQATSDGRCDLISDSRMTRPAGYRQVAEALGELRRLDHPPAEERDLAAELRRHVHEDLEAVHAGGERGDDDLPARAREDLLEGGHHVEFRPGEPGPLDVRAVREQRQHTFAAELREPVKVEVLRVERRLVHLEVAGVDDHADRRVDGHRHAVRACCA